MPASLNGARVEQWRNGSLLTTYASLLNKPGAGQPLGSGTSADPESCAVTGWGPFSRHGYAVYQTGDAFHLFGDLPDQGLFLGTLSGQQPPTNIQIIGQGRPVIALSGASPHEVFGQAVVYIGQSVGCTLPNLVIPAVATTAVGKAGVYVTGTTNLTLKQIEVSNFTNAADQVNGK